jgi:dTDP-4-dehydrorhamnose reductase
MRKIIVIGASGQLGQCLAAVVKEENLEEVAFLARAEADILEPSSLEAAFQKHSPTYCINCAAYTAVDKAEDEPEAARQVNRDGVMVLSQLCKQYNSTLIHISTDFVFSGSNVRPWGEGDVAEPINMYGLSKLEGEQAIPAHLDQHFIIRTSWLYSEYGNNFVKTMLRFGKERKELRVIWDQVGTPTYAMDLARCILRITEANTLEYGIYHYSNEGLTSWYDFAEAIFELSGVKVRVVPVRTFEYVTKAKRPAYSVLDKSKIKNNLQLDIPHWRESLKACLQNL